MTNSRRNLVILVAFAISFILILTNRNSIQQSTSIHGVAQRIGMGEWSYSYSHNGTASLSIHQKPNYQPGIPKPPGSTYQKLLIIPKTKREDTTWMDEQLPDIDKAIYVADDPDAPLHPPRNKGHEVMIYLTFIIDHYDKLPDVAIFMHAHRYAWHNADIFGMDASQMINRLSSERVMREGYVNMRCHWHPGCPDWMHPGETTFDEQKTEEILIAKAWAELFPFEPVPNVLASPCCAQFALSRERIRQIPLEKFQYYRDWLLNTPLQDFVSGRVWEYMWQYVFTGESFLCPIEHVCYCDGFGVCFGGQDEYNAWYELRSERDSWGSALDAWEKQGVEVQQAIDEGRLAEAKEMTQPEPGKDDEYRSAWHNANAKMEKMVDAALRRGADPRNRAAEAGREWKEGDGY